MSRRRWSFDLMYFLGQARWDTQITPPEVVDLVEGKKVPAGRALDLGCGTGTNSIYLAHHGWEVVGVDFAALAIRRARRKARRAKANCRFFQADVTNLSFLAPPFDLALDIGCLHSIAPEGREQYAVEVARLVQPGGLTMLYTFAPHPNRPNTPGIRPEQVRTLFDAAFTVERQEGGDDPTGPRSTWFWMRRKQ